MSRSGTGAPPVTTNRMLERSADGHRLGVRDRVKEIGVAEAHGHAVPLHQPEDRIGPWDRRAPRPFRR